MAEARSETPKIDWGKAERERQAQQPVIDRLQSTVDQLMTPQWDEKRLADFSGGKVTEYPKPTYLDRRAAKDTLKALRQLGVIKEDQIDLIPGNLEEILATHVVNERTVQQVYNATHQNDPKNNGHPPPPNGGGLHSECSSAIEASLHSLVRLPSFGHRALQIASYPSPSLRTGSLGDQDDLASVADKLR